MVRWQRIYGIAIINYILGHTAVIVDEYYALPTAPYYFKARFSPALRLVQCRCAQNNKYNHAV
jgi:hypothetical protein